MKSFLKWSVGGVGSVTLVSGTLITYSLMTQAPSCACGDISPSILRTVSYMQQEQHQKTGQFLDSNASLSADFETPHMQRSWLEHSRYAFDIQVEQDIAYSFSTPHQSYFQPQVGPFKGKKQPAFKSAVSAIAFRNEKYSWVLCDSKEPRDRPLTRPTFDGETFTCPPESRTISSNSIG